MKYRDHIDDFRRTLDSMEAGLLVRSIMSYPLATICPDAIARQFFEEHGVDGFDCAPVADDGTIIGMVYAEDVTGSNPDAIAGEIMRPLHRVPIVAATEPVAELIKQMRATQEHFWLVLEGTRINAIVTRSDLWRLPVRMLAIMRILHLEQLLTALIASKVKDNAWLEDLREERRAKITGVIAANRARNEHLEPLESTNFSDKLEILGKSLGRKKERKQLGGINALRDQLMHTRDGGDEAAGITQLLARLERIDDFIASWTGELAGPATPA